jgi:hypothetical protein
MTSCHLFHPSMRPICYLFPLMMRSALRWGCSLRGAGPGFLPALGPLPGCVLDCDPPFVGDDVMCDGIDRDF